MIWNWLLVIVGALLVLIELSLGGFAGFDMVLIGSAFLLGGALGMLIGNPWVGYGAAALLCVLYIAAGRRWMRHRLHTRATASNADALIGRSGLVTVRISRHEAGQVRIGGEVWRASPADGAAETFEPGTEVTVSGVDGVTVEVR